MVQDPQGCGKSTKTGKLIERDREGGVLLGENIGSLFIPLEWAGSGDLPVPGTGGDMGKEESKVPVLRARHT